MSPSPPSPPSPSTPFIEPPTKETIHHARQILQSTRATANALSHKIHSAEKALAQLISDSQRSIDEMHKEKKELERKEEEALAYLSLMRRMPPELLRMVFLWVFEESACCCWTLAAVCRGWRGLALATPSLWSRIRLITSPNASPDVIRLWLERSGPGEPLDIEIFLHVHTSDSDIPLLPRRRSVSFSPPWFPHMHHHPTNNNSNGYMQPAILPPQQSITILPPLPANSSDDAQGQGQRTSSWGHIVFYYLIDQMSRWKRFVFRFDKQFSSLSALKGVTGDAPLLEEFEISCLDTAFFPAEWSWFPNVSGPHTSPSPFPHLKHLTLHQAPFKTSSPIFQNLYTLSLRPLTNVHCPLDRILGLMARNTGLREVKINFMTASLPILPLHNVTLPDLYKLTLGGHHLLGTLLTHLTLPNLTSITLDIDREPIEEPLLSLLARSANPQIESLSLSHGESASVPYYAAASPIMSWSTFLSSLPDLKELKIGGVAMDPLLSVLCAPDEDENPLPNSSWLLPKLHTLSMRNCVVHVEGPGRLVQLICDRNPSGAGSNGGPARLKKVEVVECVNVFEDVVAWIRTRVEDVVFVDGGDEPRSPYLS